MPANGLSIEYHAPKYVDGVEEVEIVPEDIMSELQFWEDTVIMYVLGRDLSMNAVKQFMIRYWNFVKLPELFYHDDGYFLMKFQCNKEKEMVLMRSPYSIHNMPMVLKDWYTGFNFKRDMVRAIPIWVKLLKLPLYPWSATSLGKIGSALGKPLFTDECTTNKLRISFARILVEVDITKKLKGSIIFRDNEGESMEQLVEYEWKPLYCEECQKIGHQCTREKQISVKQRQLVKAKEKIQLPEVSTPNNPIDQTASSWTEVNKNKRVKGKIVLTDVANPGDIPCKNGFEALGNRMEQGGIYNCPMIISWNIRALNNAGNVGRLIPVSNT